MTTPNRTAIAVIRKLKGMSQRELGRRLDMSSGYVTLIESGKRRPSAAALARVAEELEVPLETITRDAA